MKRLSLFESEESKGMQVAKTKYKSEAPGSQTFEEDTTFGNVKVPKGEYYVVAKTDTDLVYIDKESGTEFNVKVENA